MPDIVNPPPIEKQNLHNAVYPIRADAIRVELPQVAGHEFLRITGLYGQILLIE